MDWLFIAGVSMDMAGAIVIASAVLWQRRPETIEEASGHWGPSLWVVLLRDREQAQARFGVMLLGVGFLLQLLAHLTNFRGYELAGAIALAIVIPVLGYLAGREVGWRKAPLTYFKHPQPPDGITDELLRIQPPQSRRRANLETAPRRTDRRSEAPTSDDSGHGGDQRGTLDSRMPELLRLAHGRDAGDRHRCLSLGLQR